MGDRMSARDDYPEAAGPTLSSYIVQHGAMCDEIDRLRRIKASDDAAYEHVVEMYHSLREDDCSDEDCDHGRLCPRRKL